MVNYQSCWNCRHYEEETNACAAEECIVDIKEDIKYINRLLDDTLLFIKTEEAREEIRITLYKAVDDLREMKERIENEGRN